MLQTDSPTESIDNATFRVDGPTKSILAVFRPTNRWSYSAVGLTTRWSRPVYRQSNFLLDNRYTSRDQCIVSPTLCRTIDTVVTTSVS